MKRPTRYRGMILKRRIKAAYVGLSFTGRSNHTDQLLIFPRSFRRIHVINHEGMALAPDASPTLIAGDINV